MDIKIISEEEFYLLPDTQDEHDDMRKAQLSCALRNRMLYVGCSDVEDDAYLRFNVGGRDRKIPTTLGSDSVSIESEPSGGTTFLIRPRGKNARKAFNLILVHGITNSTITVIPYSDGLHCKVTLHPDFDPESKEYKGNTAYTHSSAHQKW